MENLILILFLVSFFSLLIGIVSPKKVLKVKSITPNRKNVLKVFGSLTISLFIIFGLIASPVEKSNQDIEIANSSNEVEQKRVEESDFNEIKASIEEKEEEAIEFAEPNTEKEENQIIEEKSNLYKVVRIIDGDTIVLNINGVDEPIRIIGINTPEIKDPRKPVECFGLEASNKAVELLKSKDVYFEGDPTQDVRDKYNRLLGYLWTTEGVFFNQEMISQGFAYEYTYNIPYKFQAEFKEAQKYAQLNKLGLWSEGTCNGQLTKVEMKNLTETDASSPTITKSETIKLVTETKQTLTTSTPEPIIKCNIKGNISYKNSEKIYHVPGCNSYNATKINEAKGERWFCTEQEALNAGWRKALNCY